MVKIEAIVSSPCSYHDEKGLFVEIVINKIFVVNGGYVLARKAHWIVMLLDAFKEKKFTFVKDKSW
jgi:hypothetical protein